MVSANKPITQNHHAPAVLLKCSIAQLLLLVLFHGSNDGCAIDGTTTDAWPQVSDEFSSGSSVHAQWFGARAG
jgi:hypothetical protein